MFPFFTSPRVPLLFLCVLSLLCNNCGEVFKKPKPKCIRWKRNFQGVQSQHLQQNCQLPDGRPTCCAAVEREREADARASFVQEEGEGRGVGMEEYHHDDEVDPSQCTVSKQYFPSQYEQAHFQMAAELATISNADERLEKLIDFLASPDEVRSVSMHMRHTNATRVREKPESTTSAASSFIFTPAHAHAHTSCTT